MWKRILRVEPGISLGQWVYDRIVNNWQWLFAVLGLGGGGVLTGELAEAVGWVNAYGALGWWVTSLLGALTIALIGLVLAWMRYAWVRASINKKWRDNPTATINPLETEFARLRISFKDLVDPFAHIIKGKKFVDCELLGPINLFLAPNKILDSNFHACDFIAIRPGGSLYNAVVLENVDIYRCSLVQCTFFVPPEAIGVLKRAGADFVTSIQESRASVPNLKFAISAILVAMPSC